MKVVIIKYNAGNTRSVLYALERLGITATVTDCHEQIQTADKVIFPGVGEASSAMNYLEGKNLSGLIRNLKQPVLGICLGMQLLCQHSEENDVDCLGIFDLQVKKFPPRVGKVPQVGWNNIADLSSPLFRNVEEDSFVYLVHSYYVEKSEETIATTNYDLSYSAAIKSANFYATQFHPEKSADVGSRIIDNFLQFS